MTPAKATVTAASSDARIRIRDLSRGTFTPHGGSTFISESQRGQLPRMPDRDGNSDSQDGGDDGIRSPRSPLKGAHRPEDDLLEGLRGGSVLQERQERMESEYQGDTKQDHGLPAIFTAA